MSLTTCESCEKEFLTEADPYVVLPKPSGTIIMCLKCATRVAHRQGWEQAKREAVDKLDYLLQNSFGSRAMLDIAHAHISSMEYKES